MPHSIPTSDRQGTLGNGTNLDLVDELTPGTHTLTLSATDLAGNTTTASLTILKGTAAANICPAYPRSDCDLAARTRLRLADRGGSARRFSLRLKSGGTPSDRSIFGQPNVATTEAVCLYEAGRLRDALTTDPSVAHWSDTRVFRARQ